MVMAANYLSMFSLVGTRLINVILHCFPRRLWWDKMRINSPNIIRATLNVQTSAKKSEITGVTFHMHVELQVLTKVSLETAAHKAAKKALRGLRG